MSGLWVSLSSGVNLYIHSWAPSHAAVGALPVQSVASLRDPQMITRGPQTHDNSRYRDGHEDP